MNTPGRRRPCVIVPALGAYALLTLALAWAPAPAGAQALADRLAPLALDPQDTVRPAPTAAATPFAAHPARANAAGEMEPLADGHPLRADQFPRFLHPTHEGSFGFTDFLVLGDHASVTFERVDAGNGHTAETWARTGTDAVAGHLVSVFSPAWDAAVLRETLRRSSWGVDEPSLYWGRLVVPGGGGHGHVNIHLALAPSNVPASPVVRIDDRVQYASHVVNIRDDDFGDSRILGGDTALNLPEITNLFYEYFADEYEVVAVVSRTARLHDSFHQIVRNDIGGIGLDLFDESAAYGSAAVLEAVEGYSSGNWASWRIVLHEQGHQVGEYTAAWSDAGLAASTGTHAPHVHTHTPLMTPGAVTYGALEGNLRVALDTFRIEHTVPLVTYHPLTLYRMGLLSAADLPPMQVFLDQGQFGADTSSAPEVGTEVSGGTVEVTVNDLMAADGVRTGPATTAIRRAVVYVSRGGLAPQSEMDVVNYFARRLGESSGVTSWDRYPSFFEATAGGAVMTTDIRRKPPGSAAGAAASVHCAKVGVDALVGIVLDEEFGGCLTAGTSVEVSGVLNLDDENYYAVCLRFRRYGAPDGDRIYECDELNAERFSLTVTFPENEPGGYTMEAFAFSNADAQLPLTTYTGAIEVLP